MIKMLASQAAISIENSLLYQGLEQEVQQRTLQLEQTTAQVQSMLQNMPQGVCTFGADLRIEDAYSAHMEQLFDAKQIASRHIIIIIDAAIP